MSDLPINTGQKRRLDVLARYATPLLMTAVVASVAWPGAQPLALCLAAILIAASIAALRPVITLSTLVMLLIWDPAIATIAGARITAFDCAVMLGAAATVLALIARSRWSAAYLPPKPVLIALALYFVTSLVSLTCAASYLRQSIIRLGHLTVGLSLLPLLFIWVRTEEQAREFADQLLLLAVVASLASVAGFVWAVRTGLGLLAARGYWNAINLALPSLKVLGLAVALGLFLSTDAPARRHAYVLEPCAVAAGLATALSRGALITAAIGVVTVSLARRVDPRKAAMFVLVLALIVVGVSMAGRASLLDLFLSAQRQITVDVRGVLWSSSIRIWRQSPWLGVGVGNYNRYSEAYFPSDLPERFLVGLSAHSDFFDRLAETGILGTVAYVLLGLSFVVSSVRTWKTTAPRNRALASGLLACVIAFVASGYYANGFPEFLPFLAFTLLARLNDHMPVGGPKDGPRCDHSHLQ